MFIYRELHDSSDSEDIPIAMFPQQAILLLLTIELKTFDIT